MNEVIQYFVIPFGIIFGGMCLLFIGTLVIGNWLCDIIMSHDSDTPHYPDFTGR